MKGKKEKKLKVWNLNAIYDGRFRGYSLYVAAYSQSQAVEIIETKRGGHMGLHFFRTMASDCWGNKMHGITPTEPCLYIGDHTSQPPIKVETTIKDLETTI